MWVHLIHGREAQEHLSNHGRPGRDVACLSLVVERQEHADDFLSEWEEAFADLCTMSSEAGAVVIVHAKVHIHKRGRGRAFLLEQIRQLLHEADLPERRAQSAVGIEAAGEAVAVFQGGCEAEELRHWHCLVHLGVLQELVGRLDQKELQHALDDDLLEGVPALVGWQGVVWRRECGVKHLRRGGGTEQTEERIDHLLPASVVHLRHVVDDEFLQAGCADTRKCVVFLAYACA